MDWKALIAVTVVGVVSCVNWGFHRLPAELRSSLPSGQGFLEPEEARKKLFEKILDQFARSRLFGSGLAPRLFVVYAHDNKKEGTAYDGCVRQLSTWLEEIHAEILWDRKPLPLFAPRVEGTRALGNILANQMCLLPPVCDGTKSGTMIRSSVDKIIVYGSEVLEAYCSKPSARAYIRDIVQICNNYTGTLTTTKLESTLRQRVEKECKRDDFHHILTELAFLEFRVAVCSEMHNLVPVALNRIESGRPPMQYLSCFGNTDVKLKLESIDTSSLHTLFFKLLKQLYPEHREFISTYEECYKSTNRRLELDGIGSRRVARKDFTNIVDQGIVKAINEYYEKTGVYVGKSNVQNYTAKLSNDTSQILEHVNKATQRDVLDWLSTVPTSEIHGKYHDSGTRRIKGTCDWVIEDGTFRQWHECEDSALIWLQGDMGTGKTYCMSRVIDWVNDSLETHDNDEGFAFFYCNKQEPKRSQAKGILQNIIRQLAIGSLKTRSSNTAVEKTVHDLWSKHRREGIGATFAEWKACLLALIDTYPRTTIVLDALDECKDDDFSQRQDLIAFLVELANRGPGAKSVKIFVSSRPHIDVYRHLDAYPVIRMQQRRNTNDIARFLEMKISEHHTWSQFSPQLRDEMIQQILAMSKDMFLLAHLQVQQLKKCGLQSTLKKRLQNLPESLNSVYEEVYDDATSEPEERKFLDKALRWVLCAARPLTTTELLFAISQVSDSDSIKPRDPDLTEVLLRQWTQNLLSLEDTPGDGYPQRPGVWRLAHQAVAVFLQERTDCTLSLAHFEAGRVSLLLLMDKFSPKPQEFRQHHYQYGRAQYPRSVSHWPPPSGLADYAVYAWPTHIRVQDDGDAPGVDSLSRTLRGFLGQPGEGGPAYNRWIQYAFDNKSSFSGIPEWSIFHVRQMGAFYSGSGRIAPPMVVACHLGIYTCLSSWWDSPDLIHNEAYRPGRLSSWPALHRNTKHIPMSDPWSTSYSWSLISLACVHNETDIVNHLLKRNVRINTMDPDEVPPIFAAATAGWMELMGILLKRGADISSPFTAQHGTIFSFAIKSNSLQILELLVQQPGLTRAHEIEESLTSIDFKDFESTEAMALLIDRGVDVNTPLKQGTLLLAAASNGWEEMVDYLMERSAKVNIGDNLSHYKSILDALINGKKSSSPATITVFVKGGAKVDNQDLISAWLWAKPVGTILDKTGSYLEKRKQLLLVLLEFLPDINKTWDSVRYGQETWYGETSLLIEAAAMRQVELVRFLCQHGANVNLRVEHPVHDNVLEVVFQETLYTDGSPTDPSVTAHNSNMIELLLEEGANLDYLEGSRLHKALAAAAFAGWEKLMQQLLHRGASPCFSFTQEPTAEAFNQLLHGRKSKYSPNLLILNTALLAAAASDQDQAPLIIDKLLNNDPNIAEDYEFYIAARSALEWTLTKCLSDSQLLPPRDSGAWGRSAWVLATHHAVWDRNFTKWIEALKLKSPHYWRRDALIWSGLEEMLAHNRRAFFMKFPQAAFLQEWGFEYGN